MLECIVTEPPIARGTLSALVFAASASPRIVSDVGPLKGIKSPLYLQEEQNTLDLVLVAGLQVFAPHTSHSLSTLPRYTTMSAQFTRAKPHVVNGFLDVPKELPKGCKPTARPPVARGKLINNIANSCKSYNTCELERVSKLTPQRRLNARTSSSP